MQVTDNMIKKGADLKLLSENTYLPAWEDIPEEFKESYTKWNKLFSDWFFCGLAKLTVTINPDITSDKDDIIAFLDPIMRSMNSQHQHKEAGVAYLLSEIFVDAEWTVMDKNK